MVDVGSQQSPQHIYFGTDARVKDPSQCVVPIEVLAAFFFVLIALMFVGLGQEMGRRFDAIANRVAAYTADILGSLAGIVAFGLVSYFRVPAVVWFAIAMALGVCFVPRRRWLHAVGALARPRSGRAWRTGPGTRRAWRPRSSGRPITRSSSSRSTCRSTSTTSGTRGCCAIERAGPAYRLPHLLNRDAGGKPFDDVLIIGAGSGNDVAAALTQGAGTSTPSRSTR